MEVLQNADMIIASSCFTSSRRIYRDGFQFGLLLMGWQFYSRRIIRREKLVTVTGAKILLGHVSCLVSMTTQLPHLSDGVHSESETEHSFVAV